MTDVNCQKRLDDCEVLIELGNKVIVEQLDVIDKQADQIADLRFNYEQIKQDLEAEQAWYRQPEFLIPLSFIAGAVVMSQVRK